MPYLPPGATDLVWPRPRMVLRRSAPHPSRYSGPPLRAYCATGWRSQGMVWRVKRDLLQG